MSNIVSPEANQMVGLSLSKGESDDMRAGIDELAKKHGQEKIDGVHEIIAATAAEYFRSALSNGNLLALQDFSKNPDACCFR